MYFWKITNLFLYMSQIYLLPTLFRFWMHVYDQPGSQLDEAVTAVVKAFKWRKSYGVENLTDSALNRLLREYTPRRKYKVSKKSCWKWRRDIWAQVCWNIKVCSWFCHLHRQLKLCIFDKWFNMYLYSLIIFFFRELLDKGAFFRYKNYFQINRICIDKHIFW